MAGIVRKLRPGILHAAIFLKEIKNAPSALLSYISTMNADHDTITTGHATAQSSKKSNCFSFSLRRKQVQEVNSKSSIRF